MALVDHVGPPPEGAPEGSNARAVLRFVDGLAVEDDDGLLVYATLAVSLARSLDRMVSTGASASMIPNVSRQLRETLADMRMMTGTTSGLDPFEQVQERALAAQLGVTPSLFEPGPPA